MHELWQTPIYIRQHEMIVVAHRAVRVNLYAELPRGVGEAELEDLVGLGVRAKQE